MNGCCKIVIVSLNTKGKVPVNNPFHANSHLSFTWSYVTEQSQSIPLYCNNHPTVAKTNGGTIFCFRNNGSNPSCAGQGLIGWDLMMGKDVFDT